MMFSKKIWEHRVINSTFKDIATDWEKRDKSVVFNILFVNYLWIGATFAFFHSDWNMPCVQKDLKIKWKGLQMDSSHNLSMGILTISSPWALFTSCLLESDLSVNKETTEAVLLILLSIKKQSFAKKELKILLFILKSMK